jgi:hypothetical protein
MEKSRFPNFVCGFSKLVFLTAGVLMICVLAFGGYTVIKQAFRGRIFQDTVFLADANQIDEKSHLGQLEKIEGTPYLMIVLYSEQRLLGGYRSISSHSTRNILFIDPRDNSKKWLFNANYYLLMSHEWLSERDYARDSRPIRAILYTVVKKDTNGDKKLTSDDRVAVALSMPGGNAYKEILEDIDAFSGYQVLSEDTMLITYQKKDVTYSAKVGLKDFSISGQMELLEAKNRSK